MKRQGKIVHSRLTKCDSRCSVLIEMGHLNAEIGSAIVEFVYCHDLIQ